jgi:hypothetical protein
MNREDITKLAREAGGHEGDQCESCGETHTLWMFGSEELEHFAALVAAEEREACAKVCEKEAGELDTVRESLAAVTCAAAIRARGEK